MPASSPGNSSARSFRLSAAAKQSNPLPRLALLAGTSTVAIGMGMPAEYTEGQCPALTGALLWRIVDSGKG